MQLVQKVISVAKRKFSPSAGVVRLIPVAVKVAIVAGVIGAVALVGWKGPRIRPPEMVLATWLAPLMILMMPRLGQLEYGVLAILLAAGFVRFTLPTGTDTDIVASLLVATGAVALWVAKMLVVDRRIDLKPAPTNAPLLGFMSTCVVSYAWSNAFRDVLVVRWGTFPFVQLAALLVMLMLPAVFLLVSNCIEDVKWLKRMSWIVVFIGVVTIVYLVLPVSVGRAFVLRLVGVAGVGMGLLSLWVVTIAYSLALFNRRMPGWLRLLLLLLAGLWMYYGTGRLIAWMSIWLPPLCAVSVITFLRSKRLFLVMVLAGLVCVGVRFDYFYHGVYTESAAGGDFERLDLWHTNLELIRNHPLFGTGPAGYAVYYMTYHPENARSTHNNYFDIVAQTGIIGFGLYLWFFGALSYMGYRLLQKLRGQGGFEEAFACATLGGWAGAIVAMMLGDWIVPFVYNVGLEGFDHAVYAWLLLGGMAALHHIVGGHTNERRATATVSGERGGRLGQ